LFPRDGIKKGRAIARTILGPEPFRSGKGRPSQKKKKTCVHLKQERGRTEKEGSGERILPFKRICDRRTPNREGGGGKPSFLPLQERKRKMGREKPGRPNEAPKKKRGRISGPCVEKEKSVHRISSSAREEEKI